MTTKYVGVIGEEIKDLKVGDKLEINGVKGFTVTDVSFGWVDLDNDYPSCKDDVVLGTFAIAKFIEGDSHAKTVRKLVSVVEEPLTKVQVNGRLHAKLEELVGYSEFYKLKELTQFVYERRLQEEYPMQMLVDCIEKGYELECPFKVGDIVKGLYSDSVYYFTEDKRSTYCNYTLVCKSENREDK